MSGTLLTRNSVLHSACISHEIQAIILRKHTHVSKQFKLFEL